MKIIPLLNMPVGNNISAHPYPFQIAYQAQEFIQGASFYASIADISSGNYFRRAGSMEELKMQFTSGGGEPATWELGWKILAQYQDIFSITVFQNVLVAMNSHWDWYVRNLAGFLKYARDYVPSPVLGRGEQSDFKRIGSLSICHQIDVLEKSSGVHFEISDEDLANLKEMSLVRNLALHNRWEIDQIYLDKTLSRQPREIGELRLFNSSELYPWRRSLLEAIKKSWIQIASKYTSAPAYP